MIILTHDELVLVEISTRFVLGSEPVVFLIPFFNVARMSRDETAPKIKVGINHSYESINQRENKKRTRIAWPLTNTLGRNMTNGRLTDGRIDRWMDRCFFYRNVWAHLKTKKPDLTDR